MKSVLFLVGVILVLSVIRLAVEGTGEPSARGDSEASSNQTALQQGTPAWRVGAVCDQAGNCIHGDQKVVSRAEWGKRWPFTTEEVVLVCVRDLGPMGQFLVVGGMPWAANGGAQTFARVRGLTMDINGTDLPVRSFDADKDARADKFWAEQPPPEEWPADEPWGARISISDVGIALSRMGCT